MDYAIVFVSNTGNTKMLTEVIKKSIPGDCVYEGGVVDPEILPNLIFIGSYVDKGNFDSSILNFLKTMRSKHVFLFGTAGFQKTQTYYDRIINTVRMSVYPGNRIIGDYMCQGKMPQSIKEKYETMDKGKARFDVDLFIKNFDEARNHPNDDDLKRFESRLNIVFPK